MGSKGKGYDTAPAFSLIKKKMFADEAELKLGIFSPMGWYTISRGPESFLLVFFFGSI